MIRLMNFKVFILINSKCDFFYWYTCIKYDSHANLLFISFLKSNFFREFLELNPRKTKKSKQVKKMEVYWLELMLNLSFSTEGQQMILKTGGNHNKHCPV